MSRQTTLQRSRIGTDQEKRPLAARRIRLLDAAARLLNARGVSEASLTDLADELGLSRSALYYYIEDREDLVFQCYERACAITAARLDDAIGRGGGGDRIVSAFLARMLGEEPETSAIAEAGLLSPARKRAVAELHEAIVARLAAVLDAGAGEGVLRPLKSNIAARTIVSVVSWIPLAGYWSAGAAGPERATVTPAIVDLLLYGWAAHREAPLRIARTDLTPLRARPISAFDRDALREGRRETILAVASRLFNRNGVDTTSLEEIAAELGVVKRTLYRQVGDKPELLAACYRRAYRTYSFLVREAHALAASRSDALASLFYNVAIVQLTNDLQPLRPMAGYESLSAEARAEVDRGAIELTGEFTALFQSAIAEGSVRNVAMEAVRLASPGATAWLAREDIAQDADRDSIAEEIAVLLSIGVVAV